MFCGCGLKLFSPLRGGIISHCYGTSTVMFFQLSTPAKAPGTKTAFLAPPFFHMGSPQGGERAKGVNNEVKEKH